MAKCPLLVIGSGFFVFLFFFFLEEVLHIEDRKACAHYWGIFLISKSLIFIINKYMPHRRERTDYLFGLVISYLLPLLHVRKKGEKGREEG